MAFTRNEIRKRLSFFAKEQQSASNERSQAQTFWLRFYKGGKDDATRVAFLFERYQQLTSLLPAVKAKKTRKPRP